jgi:hypothetical protein
MRILDEKLHMLGYVNMNDYGGIVFNVKLKIVEIL